MVAPHHPPTMLIAIVLVIGLIIALFFSRSCARLMKAIPQEHRTMSAGLCWLMWIPAIGYIFQWMMLPFGMPRSVKHFAGSDHADLLKKGSSLFAVGITFVILPLVSWIPVVGMVFSLIAIVLWLIYWVKVCRIRKMILSLSAQA